MSLGLQLTMFPELDVAQLASDSPFTYASGTGLMSCLNVPALHALGTSLTLKLDSLTYRNTSLNLS